MLLNVLMLGDVVGQTGKRILFYKLASFKKEHKIDFCVANGENADEGFGLNPADSETLFSAGVDVITSGNHIWHYSDIDTLLQNNNILRPHNYPSPCAGKGYTSVKVKDFKFAVINLQGRSRMGYLIDCPFKTATTLVKSLKADNDFILVDFHAEDTMEKEALAMHLDGLVNAVVCTHTHVPTMDETILPKGTATIGDLGMCGSEESIIGSEIESSVKRAITGMPNKINIASSKAFFSGLIITLDSQTKKTVSIKRVFETED